MAQIKINIGPDDLQDGELAAFAAQCLNEFEQFGDADALQYADFVGMLSPNAFAMLRDAIDNFDGGNSDDC